MDLIQLKKWGLNILEVNFTERKVFYKIKVCCLYFYTQSNSLESYFNTLSIDCSIQDTYHRIKLLTLCEIRK